MSKKRMALVDVDSVLYASAFVATKKDVIYHEDDEPQDVLNPDKACAVADEIIGDWVEEAKVDDFRLVLSSPMTTHRYFIWPKYKANRPPKPELYKVVRKHIEDSYSDGNLMMLPRLEADDVMSRWNAWDGQHWERVIVSIDKDMKQLTGELITPKPRLGTFERSIIKPETARYNLWTQVITGDSVDGFRGAPGIGAKKAVTVLDGCYGRTEEHYYHVCLQAFTAQWKTERWRKDFVTANPTQELLLNLNMARLLGPQDYRCTPDNLVNVRYYDPMCFDADTVRHVRIETDDRPGMLFPTPFIRDGLTS